MRVGGLLCLVLTAALGCGGTVPDERRPATGPAAERPLRMAVMDPLAAPLACDCVKGHAQRRYDRLAQFLEKQLGRPVQVAFGENLADLLRQAGDEVHLIAGKESVVRFDAAAAKVAVRPVARLTGKDGATTLTGLFVVRRDDPARTIGNLRGYRIRFGPPWADEKHAAALEALQAHGLPLPEKIETSPGCSTAALAVVEKEADAAVLSSYAMALLEGCGTVDKGTLRIVGETAPVPFITVFVTAGVAPSTEEEIVDALVAVSRDKTLLAEMESRDGFVRWSAPGSAPATTTRAGSRADWPDWRGPRRDGLSASVPSQLPARARFLWRRPLANLGLSGIAATSRYVIVADKDREAQNDIFRCLHADTGREVWTLTYPAAGEMDYTNTPRATPVIHEDLAYLLGAFGHLHCVNLANGAVVWKRNIFRDFQAEVPTWGACATPLVVDGRLIVNPGAADASLVALNCRTGEVLWKTPGAGSAHASFIVGTFGGLRQIVGYDAVSLGGWDPKTGKRLWKLVPPESGDFNVPTPIPVGGRLLVATENNGTRLYGFDDQGRIIPRPVAQNGDLAPDASTPVVVNGLVFGVSGRLFCLDLKDGLKTRWSAEDDGFDDYVTLIAGNNRVLITTTKGRLVLIDAAPTAYRVISRLSLFDDASTEVWSHPALVGNRLYVRNESAVVCVLLDT